MGYTLFFLGNELPNYKNASGSVDRRFFMIEFNKKVHESDPHLIGKFKKNIDLFHRKSVTLYHQALRKHGEKDIWAKDVVGPQLIKGKDGVKLQTDMLYCFIKGERFQFGVSLYMPMDDFKQEYFAFRQSNGAERTRWAESHYKPVFDEASLVIMVCAKTYPPIRGLSHKSESLSVALIYDLIARQSVVVNNDKF